MKMSDILIERRKYNLVGTCVNSFDEDSMEYIKEGWTEDDPVGSLPVPIEDWGGTYESKLIQRYHEVKNAPSITSGEAEMLIAADNESFNDIIQYRYDNTPIPKRTLERMVSIMKRIEPISKTFYRGVEYEDYDDKHIMTIQSWATSTHVAKYFGNVIYRTIGGVQGVELSNLIYWDGLLRGNSNGFGDGGMGEWFLLPPNKERII